MDIIKEPMPSAVPFAVPAGELVYKMDSNIIYVSDGKGGLIDSTNAQNIAGLQLELAKAREEIARLKDLCAAYEEAVAKDVQ
jgi:hypothetical protein